MAPAKQVKIGTLLAMLKDAIPAGVNPCSVLADIVNAGKCDLWVGARRTGHGPGNVEQMLSKLALGWPSDPKYQTLDRLRDREPIAYQDSAGGPLLSIDLTDAELRLYDVQRGALACGRDLPAGLGGLTRRTRQAGGRKRKFDQAIQALFDRAVRELSQAGAAVTLKTTIKHIVKSCRPGDASKVTRLRESSLRRYLSRAKATART